ncbi:MAG: zinc-finger domain-containing protein [Gammaproteobacteria bacterium]
MNTKPREIRIVDDSLDEVACDGGGGGALGHPLVYLPFDGRTWVDCYYCGQRFSKSGYETPDAQAQGAG